MENKKTNTIHMIDLNDWVIVYDADGDLIWSDHPSGSSMCSVYESVGFDVKQVFPDGDACEFFTDNCHNPGSTFEQMTENLLKQGISPLQFED